MRFLRSVLFNVAFWVWSVCLLTFLSPPLLLPGPLRVPPAPVWGRGVIWILKWVTGITHEVRGVENIPAERVLFVSKHQSVWETILIPIVIPNAVPVVKRELVRIPLYGAYARRSGVISIDRAAGASALKTMIAEARAFIASGRDVLIYPEGTRSVPGKRLPYQPGVVALYRMLDVPVVPVALNSGLFWGRGRFVKPPGRIVMEFLPPIAPGLKRELFLAEITERIEGASDRLAAEVSGGGSGRGSPANNPGSAPSISR